MKLLKGIVHVHSNYSFDGQHSLEEIALFGRRRGYSFIGMTEHSDTFDHSKMSVYVKECRRLSDPGFLVIPGIEFTCENNLHLLGLGVEHFTYTKDPISVAQFIKRQDGLAIVAHPGRYDFKIPSGLEAEINGIEIWNSAYDGRFVPNDLSIQLWQSLKKHNVALCPLGGQDLHQITAHCHVQISVTCDELVEETVMQALKEGNFSISNPYFRLRPASLTGWMSQMSLTWARRVYTQAKAIRDRLIG